MGEPSADPGPLGRYRQRVVLGWALRFGLGALHVYRDTNPVLAAIGRRALAEAVAG